MRELNGHENEVTMKTIDLYNKFMEDLLDVLDGETLYYTVATLIDVAEEILETAKDIKESHNSKKWVEKMIEEVFGKTF